MKVHMIRTMAWGVFLLAPWACLAEAGKDAPIDASIDMTGAPAWMKLLPKPAPAPYRFPDGEERRQRYLRETFSVNTVASSAFGAGFSHLRNSPVEWEQGSDGYARRFGNSLGNAYVRNSLVHGIAAMAGEDIRYIRSDRESFKGRIGYALAMPVLARNREGRIRFSAARFIGGAANSGISRTWSPPSWRDWGNASKNYGYWLLTEAGFNVAREFFPDMLRALKGR